jgi:hypothetical protein
MIPTPNELESKLIDILNSHGIEYKAKHRPSSAFKGDEWREKAINHNIYLCNHNGSVRIDTTYSQGIAHHPLYKQGNNLVSYWQRINESLETGRLSHTKKLPKPSLVDVMHSLLVDSMGDFSSFSNWCNDYGYDSDSISAQDTFNACRDTKLSLEGLFTTESLAMMNELLEDH